MALDGMTIHMLTMELSASLLDKRISKISQPEPEQLLFTIKQARGTIRLLISANPSLPLCYLTSENKTAPDKAPNFCMLLRKHIANARITGISQPSGERVICIELEHLDELGDRRQKKLYIELMGKHSNIIFCDEEDKIIDSIRRVTAEVSSVREVLPGRDYFIPKQEGKLDPFTVTKEGFCLAITRKPIALKKAIYGSLTGFSPILAEELCYRAAVDSDASTASLKEKHLEALYSAFCSIMEEINVGGHPSIVYEPGSEQPIEYGPVKYTLYPDKKLVSLDSMSQVLLTYYRQKEIFTAMHQRSTDLRKIVQTLISRNAKKLDLQEKQLKDTEKMEKYRLYGELLQAYGHSIPEGSKKANVLNYYTNEEIEIPLDDTIPAIKNAEKFFDRYQKLKRTKEELTGFVEETRSVLDHLLSIRTSLDMAENTADLDGIRLEMEEAGFIHKKSKTLKKREEKSRPLHFITENGFDILVGKNNYQNDQLTFHTANGDDIWFHAKKMPGSHVILKKDGKEIPDEEYEIAAEVAGYYSSGRDNDKLEIDYVEDKQVKKPKGSAPGYVVYYTNYSITIHPTLLRVKEIKE